MSYAAVMVYVEADETPEQRVCLAASLADQFSATLIGVAALALPPPTARELLATSPICCFMSH